MHSPQRLPADAAEAIAPQTAGPKGSPHERDPQGRRVLLVLRRSAGPRYSRQDLPGQAVLPRGHHGTDELRDRGELAVHSPDQRRLGAVEHRARDGRRRGLVDRAAEEHDSRRESDAAANYRPISGVLAAGAQKSVRHGPGEDELRADREHNRVDRRRGS